MWKMINFLGVKIIKGGSRFGQVAERACSLVQGWFSAAREARENGLTVAPRTNPGPAEGAGNAAVFGNRRVWQ